MNIKQHLISDQLQCGSLTNNKYARPIWFVLYSRVNKDDLERMKMLFDNIVTCCQNSAAFTDALSSEATHRQQNGDELRLARE